MSNRFVLTSSFVTIENMRFYARHGVMEQERLTGNCFTVSLKVGYNLARAIRTDDVEDTLSYAEVYEIVKREMATPAQLLEGVAGRIVESLANTFPEITSINLKIKKSNPPIGADCSGAGIELYFERNQHFED